VNDDSASRHGDAVRLSDLAEQLLADARDHHSRRSARTIQSGTSMRATIIALLSEAELGEHEPPPAATLQVLSGEVALAAGERRWALSAGEVMTIPQERHSLVATTDAVVLLTVALH
jgi:quercetin dioxygenase-like cupin family protein